MVVSGLPGSGKTTLARRLTAPLNLPVLDKDDILERLFESLGAGNAARRRALSRESDRMLQGQARASSGAILTSLWHQPGMPEQSGTPTDWLAGLTACIVNVHCTCDPEIAALRFFSRKRHPGHLDKGRSYSHVLASLRKLPVTAPLEGYPRVEVDTAQELNLSAVVGQIRRAFKRCAGTIPLENPE